MGMYAEQLEKAWTANHAVGRSSPGCYKNRTKHLQQVINFKAADQKPKLGGPVHHNTIMVHIKDLLLLSAQKASVKAAWCCTLHLFALH